MKLLLCIISTAILLMGCEKKDSVEIIPSYDSIYLAPGDLDKKPQLIEGDENKLLDDIQKEMNKKAQDKINLEYKFLVGESGKIEKIMEIKTAGAEYSGLIASDISNWKFEPGIKNNKAVKSQYTWEFNSPAENIIESEFKVSGDTMPLPVGGMKALQQNIVYPENAKQQGIEGKVIVQIYIDETGKVVKTEVLKGAGDELDAAAMDALQRTRFTPGILNGKPIKVRIIVPVVFRLS